MSRTDDHESVALPTSVYDAVESRVGETEFESVDEYVTFCLEEIVQATTDGSAANVDEQEVKQRLESLGYVE